jgi:hypothetical protein
MKTNELRIAIRLKSMEFETAMENQKPHEDLLKLYKEIKELQYQLVQSELAEESRQLKTA